MPSDEFEYDIYHHGSFDEKRGIVIAPSGDILLALNDLGKKGWEICGVLDGKSYCPATFYLKRRLNAKP